MENIGESIERRLFCSLNLPTKDIWLCLYLNGNISSFDQFHHETISGGEVITGTIRIELRSPIVINAVKLQLKGRAAWLNDPVKKDNIEKVYFDQDFTLLERPPGKAEAGHFVWIGGFPYTLPFECPLPKKEYYVKKAFSIVSPSDGHVVKGEPVTAKDFVNYGKCCCKGKLEAEMSLPKTGYLPGEMVVGSIKVGNKYPKDILQNMEARLVDRVVRIGGPEKSSTSPYRTLYCRRVEIPEPTKGTKKLQKDDLHLLTIPPVCPSTKGDFDPTKELHTLAPDSIVESPSTATLRQRRQPFIRIEYAIQLSLGNHVLLEAPITIGELSTHDSSNALKPFVAGPQPIEEVDETQRIAIGGPFTYTPVYTMKLNPSTEAKSASDGPTRQAGTKSEIEETATERTALLKHNASDNDEPADVAVPKVEVSQHETSEQTTQPDVANESSDVQDRRCHAKY
ncbi:arrestin domain protein [Oesophagostomum dentatum]|uniref:Arrestin domain protein n=1 Tax=Oesophagostomum dentatum TaxID=61180 RepID=A0A0B1TMY6_OESDE|nr:arrestin domain protein [Oesophagostomum dentatum]